VLSLTSWIATAGGAAGFLWLPPSPLPRFRRPAGGQARADAG
jgi:hypothetical protein